MLRPANRYTLELNKLVLILIGKLISKEYSEFSFEVLKYGTL